LVLVDQADVQGQEAEEQVTRRLVASEHGVSLLILEVGIADRRIAERKSFGHHLFCD